MGFGEAFPIVLASLVIYGIPMVVVIWVVVNVRRISARLDQIHERIEALSARLDSKR